MSLSISSSEPTAAAVTTDGKPTGQGSRYAAVEQRWAWRLCLISPLLAVLAVPICHRYLLRFLYLTPIDSPWQISQAFHSKVAIVAALGAASVPWLWLIGLKAESWLQRERIPWAVFFAAGGLLTASLVLTTPRATWFFVEWVKIRTPNPSFARNTLFWEQRNFEHTQSSHGIARVGLVGSSQTYQGFDLAQLQEAVPTMTFEKNTLAGFGPMQYPFLLDRIRERNFDVIVCQLSEFDFFREDEVPVSRLRWAASQTGVQRLTAALTRKQMSDNRAALADLLFAGWVPLWRQRDHFRRTAFGYWWRKCDPLPMTQSEPRQLARAPGLQEAITFLKTNVGRKKLVDANFRSFEEFAEQLSVTGTRLIVMEGQVHPIARAAYDRDHLQQTTRVALTEMSRADGFEYLDNRLLPSFTADDFADAYHLNNTGRDKLSAFLAHHLTHDNTSN